MYEVGNKKVCRYLEGRGVGEDVVYIPTRLAVCLPGGGGGGRGEGGGVSEDVVYIPTRLAVCVPSGGHPQPPNGGIGSNIEGRNWWNWICQQLHPAIHTPLTYTYLCMQIHSICTVYVHFQHFDEGT